MCSGSRLSPGQNREAPVHRTGASLLHPQLASLVLADFYNCSELNYRPLLAKLHDEKMFRTLATLAIAVSIDLYLFDGKYTHAVELLALSILQHFWVL